MNRRNTVSVTPAMGASTVAGWIETFPTRNSEGNSILLILAGCLTSVDNGPSSGLAYVPIALLRRKGMFRYCVSVVIAVICAVTLSAQFTTASLGGEVRDATGSTVPDARVTVRNVETGFTQSVSTDATGAFLFPRLPVGNYELRVEKAGFTTYVQAGIGLTVDRAATQSVVLQVGQVSE